VKVKAQLQFLVEAQTQQMKYKPLLEIFLFDIIAGM
jgi:hypothetical protein